MITVPRKNFEYDVFFQKSDTRNSYSNLQLDWKLLLLVSIWFSENVEYAENVGYDFENIADAKTPIIESKEMRNVTYQRGARILGRTQLLWERHN